VFQIRAGLDAKRLSAAWKVMWSQLRKVVKEGVTAQELAMAKDHVRGALALSLEDSSDQAEFYGRQEMWRGMVETPSQRLAQYDRVTRTQVHRAAREILRLDRLAVAAIGPFNEAEFEKQIRV
jgi:predicted Zn-dependent peptidase